MKPLNTSQVGRFYNSLHSDEFSGCVEWTAALDKQGYGLFYANGTTYKAHRLSWLLHTKEDPGSFCVCHSCDNPKCVNPYHLFLGTVQDNNHDRHSKGRSRNRPTPGETHVMAKLTEIDVLAIRQDARKLKAISADYGVSESMVSLIRNGKKWKHLTHA